MTIKTKIEDKDCILSCTFTCYQWLNLFAITDFYNEIYNWFDILKTNNNHIIGYVIMPNHLHFLIYLNQQGKSIDQIIGAGKRFMAYSIVDKLKKLQRTDILEILEKGVLPNEKKKGKLHSVFEPSFDVKPCYSERFVLQKLDYFHRNPVSGKWNLVEDFIDYPHSSARFYELNEIGLYPVKHFKDVWEGA